MKNEVARRSRGKPFTVEDKIEIMKMCAEGYLVGEIAEKLGESEKRIRYNVNYICKNALRGKRLQIEQKKKDRELLKAYYRGEL